MTTADQERLVQTWIHAAERRDHHTTSRNRELKIERLKQVAVLRFTGRIDALMEHFAEDCEMFVAGGPQFNPLSGRCHGREEVRTKLQSLHAVFDFLDLEFISIIVENDDVAIRWKCQPRRQKAGPGEWLEGMSVVHFRGELITYYGNFLDTAVLARLIDWKRLAAPADTES
jgi:ketosteroid isomerase-like protein